MDQHSGPRYQCSSCNEEHPPTEWRCSCGAPLEFLETPLPDTPPPARPTASNRAASRLDRDSGLWAFESFLPVERSVTLGEGFTPLIDAPDGDVTYKLEWLFPTGSFKDRGAAVILSHAHNLGVERVVEDSSGNAGAAIATYAARAGIDAEIFVPADANAGKLRAIERTGATVRRISGTRQDVTDACVAALESDSSAERTNTSGAWYASHAWNPAFFEGTATFAYEIVAQRGWSVPDAVVTPLGHGTLFLGAYRGFERLSRAGWTDEIPRLYGVQAAGVAPVVSDRHGASAAEGANAIADGIQITAPVRRTQIHEALDTTGGDVLAVDADTTRAAYDRLHRQGFFVESTAAVGAAAYDELRSAGEIDADEDVIVALTGTGKNETSTV